MRRRLRVLLVSLLWLAPLPAAADESAPLDEELLGQMLEAYVRSAADAPVAAIELPSLRRFARAEVENFDVSVRASDESEMRGWVPIELAVSSEGRTLEEGVVKVRVDTQRDIVVARRTLPRGTVLRATDLQIEPRLERNLPDQVLDSIDVAVGQALTRSVGKGRPVTDDVIAPPPVVKRGQQVRIELRHGRLRIESLGRAQEDARAGDWLRVRTRGSKQEVTGRVDADGVVHVSL